MDNYNPRYSQIEFKLAYGTNIILFNKLILTSNKIEGPYSDNSYGWYCNEYKYYRPDGSIKSIPFIDKLRTTPIYKLLHNI